MLTKTFYRTKIEIRLLILISSIIIAVVLPQIFHFIGKITGYNASIGAAILPMHIPVYVAGLILGPLWGLVAGLLSPLVSYAVSGMPSIAMLPFMVIELGAYGLIIGFLKKVKMPVMVKILIAQIGGRLIKLSSIAIAVFVFTSTNISLISVWTATLDGIFGIALQLILIPLCMMIIKKNGKRYE